MGAIGVKGSHTAAAKMENVFPNDEDAENLMYLQGNASTTLQKPVIEFTASASKQRNGTGHLSKLPTTIGLGEIEYAMEWCSKVQNNVLGGILPTCTLVC